ncbi:MAG: UDP-2,3-diacylglucosamine diphosphatase [Ignavibacteria bacterium]|nr:UDP-2,3-diacylglucosamine diphosphatase [Ignavibacteria bacterium]
MSADQQKPLPHNQTKTPKRTYFFSDAHLGLGSREENQQRERRIVKFLNRVASDGERLFIVGDLFDYWFEYRSVVPKGWIRLLGKLAELSDRGIKIFYVNGNHDFWMNDYFRTELGIEVHHDPLECTISGKKFYIHHGDGLLKKDRGYRILKSILRNRFSIALYSILHPDWTNALARWSSRTSRKHASNKTFEGNDMVEFAERRIRQGFDYVVMGHHHRPIVRNFGRGVYVNLGDWISENSYAVFDGKHLRLEWWQQRRGRDRFWRRRKHLNRTS